MIYENPNYKWGISCKICSMTLYIRYAMSQIYCLKKGETELRYLMYEIS